MNERRSIVDFGEPEKEKSIIKVIGVGGGGGNAVNHMYREGIHDVSFVLCNTDNQALNDSPVPVHLQLGKEGLGAGNKPEKAREAAEESIEDVRKMLGDGTKMAFITAGMGGGTGTGAAPVIARESKEMGILTVGIVTIPFRFEGERKIDQALDGVEEMSKHVDALLVINNERLREIYPELSILDAFGKADDILAAATKGIAEIITVESAFIRVDFADLERVMRGSGRAHMGVASAEGEGRALEAARRSLCSPLLDNNLISGAKNILINISAANIDDVAYDETMEILNYIQSYASYKDEDGVEHQANLIWGASSKPMPENVLEVVVVATGFSDDDTPRKAPAQQPFRQQPFDMDIVPVDDTDDEPMPAEDVPAAAPQTPQPTVAPQQRHHAATPAVLDRKPSKYNNIEADIRTPAFKRRNVMFVIEQNDGVTRRKEVLRDDRAEQGDDTKKTYDTPLF